jgi:hypothetical protein
MIGHFGFASSFGGALNYCMQDKEVRKEQTQDLAKEERRQTRNRAEILYYHQCYGNIKQLTRQFKEVQKQNFNAKKPAFHLSLSLGPEDKIPKSRFVDIAKDCAKALDFERHQYLVILHKDTPNPHVHLVVNRIGPEKHLMDLKNNNILKRVNRFCRDAEIKYQLTQLKGIRWYRSPEERLKPSQDQRLLQLKEEIAQTLRHSQDLTSFIDQMQQRGCKVYKTERGISFKDRDGVYFTGFKAGYPWKEIEAALTQNLAERQAQEQRLEQERIKQLEIKRKQELTEDDGPQQVQRRGLRMRM